MERDLTSEQLQELLNAALSLPSPDESYLETLHDIMLQLQLALYQQTLALEAVHRDYLKVKLLEHSYQQVSELGLLPHWHTELPSGEEMGREQREVFAAGWKQALSRIFSTHLIMDSWYATQSSKNRELWRQLLLNEQSPVTVNVTWEGEQPLVQVLCSVIGFKTTKQQRIIRNEDLSIAVECFNRWGTEGFAGWFSVRVGQNREGLITGSYTHARRLAQDHYTGEADE